MPPGLTNGVPTFQRFLKRVLDGVLGYYAFANVDDVVIASDTWPGHLMHMDKVFSRLQKA